MADVGEKAAKQLTKITECPICMSDFTDPRMLPCIHTFCLECLKRIGEEAQMKPGDKMPCPFCRKEFIIPVDGMKGVQKNFFMLNFLKFKTTLQLGSNTIILCGTCNIRNEGRTVEITKATMRCLECQDNYCDSCVKVHQYQKLIKHHHLVQIGSDSKSEMKRTFSALYCSKHTQKMLDYYCTDCKKIVCVSCFVESHKLHDCKDVTAAVDEEFRQAIQTNSSKISIFADEMLSLRRNVEIRKEKFLKEIVDNENAIHRRNQELKDIIDMHTKSLLDELSAIKSNHLKQLESEMEEIDRSRTKLKSYEAYCTELRLKGSASAICSSVDKLLVRADDLERDHEATIGRPHQTVEVSFQTTDLLEISQTSKNNVVGEIKETTSQFENCAIVVGLDDDLNLTKDVIKINLHRPNEISTLEQIPTDMLFETFAAVYCNQMYVTGVGDNVNEIWKYSFVSGWMKCASLVEGRNNHSAAFINEVLYICGGFVYSNESVLDSVEAFNAITDKCAVVGKLVQCVYSSGNCVPFKSSLYIFGGSDKDNKSLNCVQMYNTKSNTCSVLSKPMPRPCCLMGTVLWDTSVILVGCDTCFVFNFETETWQERKQFKTDVDHFGLLLANGRVFVIGGGIYKEDKDDNDVWICRDDVRYVPLQHVINDKVVEWKIHGKLPEPTLVRAYAKMHILSYST